MKISIYPPLSFIQMGARSGQEDSRWPDSDRMEASQRAFVVCDGVGGSSRGEVASATVCRTMGEQLKDVGPQTLFTTQQFSQVLDAAYDALDDAGASSVGDMATTMTMLVLHSEGAVMAHIGDSRIYQVRPEVGIVYRSDDHSLVAQMVRSGIITPDEARIHPQRNVITRCMAPTRGDETRCMATLTRSGDVKAGDYFLLCTDGVSGTIDDAELVEILTSELSDEQKMERLATLSATSSDNNTATLVHIKEVENSHSHQSAIPTREDNRGATPHPSTAGDSDTAETLPGTTLLTVVEEVESLRKAPTQAGKIGKFIKKLFNLNT